MAAPICVARIGAAHGVRGAVKLWTFTEDPLAVKHYGPLTTKDGARQFEVAHVREARDHLVATLKGIATREDAERLVGGVDRGKPDQVGVIIFVLVSLGQFFARNIELDAVEPFGILAGGDAFQRRHQMILGLTDMRHLELARAVLGHQRAVVLHGERIFGERP